MLGCPISHAICSGGCCINIHLTKFCGVLVPPSGASGPSLALLSTSGDDFVPVVRSETVMFHGVPVCAPLNMRIRRLSSPCMTSGVLVPDCLMSPLKAAYCCNVLELTAHTGTHAVYVFGACTGTSSPFGLQYGA